MKILRLNMATYQLEVYKSHWASPKSSSFVHHQEILGASLDDAFEQAQEEIIRWENRSESTIARVVNIRDESEDRWYNLLHDGEWYHPSEKRERVQIP